MKESIEGKPIMEKDKSKLAVIFPGVGYNKDRPLLYYTARLATKHGYDVIKVDFSGIEWDKETLKDPKKLEKILEFCLDRTKEAVKDIDINSLKDVVFISKSIGTVVSSAYAYNNDLDVKQVFFTPLPYIDSYVRPRKGLVFYGTADPYADPEIIAEICRKYDLDTTSVDGANHSLETEDTIHNIDIIKEVMEKTERIFLEEK